MENEYAACAVMIGLCQGKLVPRTKILHHCARFRQDLFFLAGETWRNKCTEQALDFALRPLPNTCHMGAHLQRKERRRKHCKHYKSQMSDYERRVTVSEEGGLRATSIRAHRKARTGGKGSAPTNREDKPKKLLTIRNISTAGNIACTR